VVHKLDYINYNYSDNVQEQTSNPLGSSYSGVAKPGGSSLDIDGLIKHKKITHTVNAQLSPQHRMGNT